MCETTSGEPQVYSLATSTIAGTTHTGLDQFVGFIFDDVGLAGTANAQDIATAAHDADELNKLIIQAANAVHAADDGVFTTTEVIAMNAWIRANCLAQWTALHGDDEPTYETGYHLVQNDGGTAEYRGDNLLDTVIDSVYHMGFEICAGHFLNEDGDQNASVEDVAGWLTQFYADHSTTGTPLDRLTDLIQGDQGLGCSIGDTQIAAGADAANGLNKMLMAAIDATGVLKDKSISADDVTTLANYIGGNANLLAQWKLLHGSDSKTAGETGFHQVKGDGGWSDLFGVSLVNTVAEGIYDIGFGAANGQLVNEKGRATATTSDVAGWLNYFLADQTTTGTGLDTMIDFAKRDPGLAQCTSAADISAGIADANDMNGLIVGMINSLHANDDHWITTEEVTAMNTIIRSDPALLQKWTALHGDDEDTYETGYHLVQNDGADANFLGDNLVNTVADGIYHMCFQICDGRFLNEDGDLNVGVDQVATWLNFFYNNATVVMGDWGDNTIAGTDGAEQINAGGGDDVVNGAGGDDLIYGDWGNDTINAGAGNDLIYGQGGDDVLSGGAGDDIFRVTGRYSDTDCTFEGYDSYDGGAGKDTIRAFGGDVDIGMTAFAASNGIEVVDASGATGTVRLLGDWNANVLDFSGVSLLGGKIVIDGGGGNDTITGSAGDDIIEGGDWGDQSIAGGAGNDVIHGGGGDDVLSGGTGNDTFRVTGCNSDKDCTFEGYDSYDGGAGQDKIVAYGTKVDIGMTAFSTANSVETIDATGATGSVRLLGDWCDNVLDFSGISLLGSNIVIDGGGGNDTIIGSAGNDVIECGDWGEQNISGGAGNDVIHGGAGNDLLSGGAGDDTFRVTGNKNSAFEDYDSYDGGAGKDRIVAYGNTVDIGMTAFGPTNGVEVIDATGAQGVIRIIGDWNDNTLDFSGTSFLGKISVDGGGGNDKLTGTSGDDTLLGSGGDDVLIGGLGSDKLTGGAGKDVFSFGKSWGHDVITDFKHGTDKLNFHDAGVANRQGLTITAFSGGTLISFGGQDVLLQGVAPTTVTSGDFVF